jgi:hypothetical protein
MNCLIKKVLEMGIVASNKKVLEINETYRQWQGPRGGKDEAHDATAAGGIAKAAARYQRSRKREKSLILSELVEPTEYGRFMLGACCGNGVDELQVGQQTLEADIREHSAVSVGLLR